MVWPALCRQRGVAQFGSALDWGSRGRKFKSCLSDQKRSVESLKKFNTSFCILLSWLAF